jgi:hypothetical protein
MAKADLTAQRLRELLHYDPETGVFTWRAPLGKKTKPGQVAGTLHAAGFVSIGVGGFSYKAHRLAWLHVYGEWPTNVIDHIDGRPANNCIRNLRDVSMLVNMQNLRRARSDSKSGVQGVALHPETGKWRPRLRLGGRNISLGLYETIGEAQTAYLEAKRLLHEGCTI